VGAQNVLASPVYRQNNKRRASKNFCAEKVLKRQAKELMIATIQSIPQPTTPSQLHHTQDTGAKLRISSCHFCSGEERTENPKSSFLPFA